MCRNYDQSSLMWLRPSFYCLRLKTYFLYPTKQTDQVGSFCYLCLFTIHIVYSLSGQLAAALSANNSVYWKLYKNSCRMTGKFNFSKSYKQTEENRIQRLHESTRNSLNLFAGLFSVSLSPLSKYLNPALHYTTLQTTTLHI